MPRTDVDGQVYQVYVKAAAGIPDQNGDCDSPFLASLVDTRRSNSAQTRCPVILHCAISSQSSTCNLLTHQYAAAASSPDVMR